MADRQVGIVMTPTEAHEAKGVIINRTIGSEKLVILDPFMLCDHLTVANDGTDVSEIGFPKHPHRGIETLTYVFAGRMRHKDSMGNEEVVSAGETQFMTAGAGLFHEEMVFADENGHESLQIWFNLPRKRRFRPLTAPPTTRKCRSSPRRKGRAYELLPERLRDTSGH